ncbi:helix-turn-helix domain-containing protein [Parasaccharibacter apium]|uniref:XRE family transcriptional regulator n=1 Tax=Parasaccharibacter apium TaxID=1510841 RepID=A0ABX4ZL61_9PROT|nr:helix-turn-helix transcriptional regulator [Parasaccharibacter apium]POS62082.1 XRE family transcriptional regulator [Parasaccharibacter apium]POS65704.1 XRE family transcriptional regulator [Parasaccharibacter apium]POS65974.1 XRE family transcriptional regulator [Parasaccharibacter apium]
MNGKYTKKDSKSLRNVVAYNIRRLRLNMDLSQEELADICGYHRTYISSIERSERNITLATLEALSNALNASPSDLLEMKHESH